jgi:hypothetical protein
MIEPSTGNTAATPAAMPGLVPGFVPGIFRFVYFVIVRTGEIM